jgi:hypothetical protein
MVASVLLGVLSRTKPEAADSYVAGGADHTFECRGSPFGVVVARLCEVSREETGPESLEVRQ